MSLTRRLAAAVVPPEDDGGEPLPERGWRTTVVGVHVISAVVWVLAVVSVVVGDAVDADRRAPALAVLAALAVAYVVLGVPAISAGARGRAVAYLVVLVAAFGLLGWLAPGLLFLLLLAYPQVWFAVHGALTGIAWTLLLGLSSAAGPVLRAVTAESGRTAGDVLFETGIGIAFSLALGV